MGQTEAATARFSALFQRHYEPVLRYAQRRTDLPTADDVAAEVFLVAWRRLSDVPDDALPWLIGTARKVLANERRGRRRQAALRLRLDGERPGEPATSAEQVDAAARWRSALASLGPRDQEVLALLAWDGLTVAQAAVSMGCSTSAFAMRLSRARSRLSHALHDEDDAADVSPVERTVR